MTNQIFIQLIRDKHPQLCAPVTKEMIDQEVRHMGWTYFKLTEDDAISAYKKALRSALYDMISKRVDVASIDLFWFLRKKTKNEMFDMKMAHLKARKRGGTS